MKMLVNLVGYAVVGVVLLFVGSMFDNDAKAIKDRIVSYVWAIADPPKASDGSAIPGTFIGHSAVDGCDYYATSVTPLFRINQSTGISYYNGHLRVSTMADCPEGTTVKLGDRFVAYRRMRATEYVSCAKRQFWSESQSWYDAGDVLTRWYRPGNPEFFNDDNRSLGGEELESQGRGAPIARDSPYGTFANMYCSRFKDGTPVKK